MKDPCSICGIMVNRKNKTRHMKLHSKVKFVCKNCDKPFSRSDVLKRHEKTHGPPKYNCIPCEKSFQSRDSLRNHIKVDHEFIRFPCIHCRNKFTSISYLKKHQIKCKPKIKTQCYICLK